MARWYGMKLAEIRAMTLIDFWMLDGFLARHPPVDLIAASAAAHFGLQRQKQSGTAAPERPSMHTAARANREGLAQMPPRRKVKSLDQMPAFLRTPEKLAEIERMKAKWAMS